MRSSSLLTLTCLLLISLPGRAQETSAPKPAQADPPKPDAKPGAKPSDPMSSGTFAGFRLRSIGPAVISGRVIAFAVNPNDRCQYYVGVASGGVWKTTNAGTTWTAVFDKEGSYSIGAVALDPKNPSVVWVGTGEGNSQRSVGYGDGVYRTDDGGGSWKNVGLKASQHIGRIAIDPRHTDTIYVAAQGPLWAPGGDRGLFKTTDGGKTWKTVLAISENTGVTEVVLDPQNPDTLYAASYQRRRHVWTLIDGGPESAIYKSTDAGATWTKLHSGLPAGEMGRIGLAVSSIEPRVIYATVEASNKAGGIFRSADYGATWEKRNDFDSGAMYYGQIIADPKSVDRVYVLNVVNQVSDDGGRTLRPLDERSKHVDNHALWIDPNNTNYYLAGCDGGVYESFDRGATWQYKSNLPTPQFYDVTTDNAAPFYHVYGGTQDNFSLGGPARLRGADGITNADWFVTAGGDGFQSRVDPEDPDTIYAESQYGGLVRFDRRNGERIAIQPQAGAGEPPLRWNWDSPLLVSPHRHTRLYFAANRLFRSDDRGGQWKAISDELSRGLDRDKLAVMGKLWSVDAVAKHQSTSFYGNATALAESPKKEGLLYVGTDDGLIQVTQDGGGTWRKIDTFPGIPATTYVSRVLASQHATETVYAAFDNHKNGDFAPYLLKSADAGKTWVAVTGDLPANGPVLAIAEDAVRPDLLFAGTEFGLYFTLNGGGKWIKLTNGLPTIPVRDIAIQRQMDDLVLATFGRGIYVLDDFAPLRTVTSDLLAQESALFPVKDALSYVPPSRLGGGRGFQGESYYVGENASFGAVFTYYLKDAPKTRRQKRQEAEREAERKKEPPPHPSMDDLRAEEEEEPHALVFTIVDARGDVVRRLLAPAQAGIHRVTWDLRHASALPPPEPGAPPARGRSAGSPEEAGGFSNPSGPLVVPGTYRVRMAKREDGILTDLPGVQTFRVIAESASSTDPAARAALARFQQQAARLEGAGNAASESANALNARLTLIKQALQQAPAAPLRLRAEAIALQKRVEEVLRALRGDSVARAHEENTPPSILDRIGAVVYSGYGSTAAPTESQRDGYTIASRALAQEVTRLRALMTGDLPRLERGLEAAGVPWTPGRLPEWKDGNDRP